MNVVRILFLAAGKATRLHPYTLNQSKWMLNLFGQPILQHNINVAHSCNVTDVVVIRAESEETVFTPSVAYAKSPPTGNMLQTLFCASSHFSDDLIISYSDILYEPRVLRTLIDAPHPISVVVDRNWFSYFSARAEKPISIAETCLVAKGYIRSIGQPIIDGVPPLHQYIGLLRVRGIGVEIFRTLYSNLEQTYRGRSWRNAADFSKAFMTDFLQELIDRGIPVAAIPCDGGWLEFDTVSDYDNTQQWYKDGSLARFFAVEALPRFPAVCSAGGLIPRQAPDSQPEFLLVGTGVPGGWRIPKGMQDPGETLRQTATREVFEETAVFGEPVDCLGHEEWDYDFGGCRWHERGHFFLMRPISTAPPHPDAEHAVAAWVPADHALAGLTYDTEKEVLRRALALIGATSNAP